MKLLNEPLLHFLLIGGVLFALSAWSNPDGAVEESDTRIVVPAGRIEQLARIFVKTWQRPPRAPELKGLVDDFVLEEAYYRQAKAMGLDRDDTMIRRRLRQKLEFLSDDAASLVEPEDADLEAYLAAQPDKFRRDPVFTFRQLYFNPERHGDDPSAAVRAQAEALRAGAEIEGDRSLLPPAFDEATGREVDSSFGTGFARKLEKLTPGVWSDPIASGLGLHLVWLDAFTPGRLPSLEEARPIVRREWENDKRLETRRIMNEALLKDYEVLVEWPDVGVDTAGE